MQPTTDYDDGEQYAPITIRFEKDKAKQQRMSVATNYKAVFFSEPIPPIKTMLQRKNLVVQFTPYQSGIATISFNLSGFPRRFHRFRKPVSGNNGPRGRIERDIKPAYASSIGAPISPPWEAHSELP